MIKRTLYFGNPTYLKTKDEKLVIKSANTKAVWAIVVLSNVIVLN